MSKRDWAREKVDRYLDSFGYFHGLIPSDAAKLLQLERARARRIVRVYIRECKANIAAIDDGYRVGLLEPAYEVNTLQREIGACEELLRRLA